MTAAGETGARGGQRKAKSAILHRTSLGALAVSGASAIRLGLQFALMPILARLVGPSEYGLVALAMPFILLANVLSDGGMGYALGRRREASPELESTVFWLAGSLGAALALICCAAALPIGWVMHQPRLPPLIMALSPILLMNSLAAVSNGRVIREGRFAVFAAGDLISTLIGAAAALAAATHGLGAWSLIAQQLALWITKLVWLTWKARARIGLRWRFAEAKPLLNFGVSTIGAMLADFLSRNADNMIVGWALGATALGFYAMAYQIIRMPDMLISGPFYLYIFTAAARTEGDARAVRDMAAAGLRLGSAGLAPLFCGLALVADLAVGVVLGPKWLGAVAPLRWLAGAGFCFCICSWMAAMLMGLGRSGLQLKMSIALALATVVAVAAGARFGLTVVSALLAAGLVLVFAAYVVQLARAVKAPLPGLLPAFAPAIVGCAVMTAVVLAARQALAAAAPVAQLLLAILLGGASYLAVLWALARRRLIDDVQVFAKAQADTPPVQAAEQVEAVEALSGVA